MIKFLKEFLKEIFIPELLVKEITLTFLEKKRMELITTEKYIRWLKKRLVICKVVKITREEKPLRKLILKDLSVEEAIKLLEEELNKFEIKKIQ